MWEVTFWDYGCEVGTFDFGEEPVEGCVLSDDDGQYLVARVRMKDVDSQVAEVDVEYL